jgi:hypothetical protein
MAIYPKMTVLEAAKYLIENCKACQRVLPKHKKNMNLHEFMESDVIRNLKSAIAREGG